MQSLHTGYSLIEALLCLALAALLLGLALPPLSPLLAEQRVSAAIMQLERSLALARAAAVERGRRLTLCPNNGGTECLRDWTRGSMLFHDANGNRRLDAGEALLRRGMGAGKGLTIIYRAFGNRQYLQFTPQGFTNQNGNFTLCPAGDDGGRARQLIISRTGRTRRAVDEDGDGLREDSRGRPLRCPP